jgi:hypothetical protein
MAGLVLNKAGQQRIFAPSQQVIVMDGQNPVPRGTWRTWTPADGDRHNLLHYTFDGNTAEPVAIRWSFTQDNQLQGIIPATANGGADSDPCAFAGQIHVDDNRDIAYRLLDDDGNLTEKSLVVVGDLHFDEADNALVIQLPEGGDPVRITGDSGLTSLRTGMYPLSDFKASDFLRFRASTLNLLGDGRPVTSEADIQWVGNWDLQSNQLVFAAEVQNRPGQEPVKIILAGKTKAVAGGLVYYNGPDGEQEAALEISGSHQWNGGEGHWEVAIGYSRMDKQNKLTAKLAGDVTIKRQSGQRFTLGGKIEFAQDGRDTTLDLELEGSYQWGPGGALQFSAVVSVENHKLNYDLRLEGQFHYDGFQLNFSIEFSRTGNEQKLILRLAARGDNDFLFQLSLVLNLNDPRQVDIEFKFELRVKWIDGVLIKEKPVPKAA